MMQTQTDRNRYQRMLHQKLQELLSGLSRRDGLSIGQSADTLDAIQCAVDRDLTFHNLSHESHLLRQVRSALQKLNGGEFGVCSECEAPIGPNRLAVIPWAPRCIHCQTAADLHGEVPQESFFPRAGDSTL